MKSASIQRFVIAFDALDRAANMAGQNIQHLRVVIDANVSRRRSFYRAIWRRRRKAAAWRKRR